MKNLIAVVIVSDRITITKNDENTDPESRKFDSALEAFLYALAISEDQGVLITNEIITATLCGLEAVVRDYLEILDPVQLT